LRRYHLHIHQFQHLNFARLHDVSLELFVPICAPLSLKCIDGASCLPKRRILRDNQTPFESYDSLLSLSWFILTMTDAFATFVTTYTYTSLLHHHIRLVELATDESSQQ
jgi:hypothetical protein